MKTSDSITKIAPALLAAQRKITFAVKDSKNPAFRSTYADLSSVIEACKPALNEAGIVFIQMPSESDSGTLALTTRLMHESGEWIEATATCPLPKLDPQGYGSANTYLRRYSLAAAVGLYQDDDDGNAAAKAKTTAARTEGTQASGTISATRIAFEELPQDWKDYLTAFAPQVENICEQQGPQAAQDHITKNELENDHIAGLFHLLSSKTRSAINSLTKSAPTKRMKEPA